MKNEKRTHFGGSPFGRVSHNLMPHFPLNSPKAASVKTKNEKRTHF